MPKLMQFFGKWAVLEELPGKLWKCKCECGRIEMISKNALKYGKSSACKSCCQKFNRKYPQGTDLRTLHRVHDAIRRCTDPSYRKYHDYGGRGISVYQAWVNDKIAFAAYLLTLPGWDNPKLVLDRINNEGNYEPGNLRFVTVSESLYNRRCERTIMLDKRFESSIKNLYRRGAKLVDIARLYCVDPSVIGEVCGRRGIRPDKRIGGKA